MKVIRALVLAVALVSTTGIAIEPALAAGDSRAEVERLARQAAEQIVAALRILLRAIPQYEAPEILPNGDIIIRRIPPDEPDEEAPRDYPDDDIPEDPDQTET
ncbi:MAG: hypothetical protein QF893_04710 [Alphaproteobacteria bacterium]|jgi:hypothetical protein|nr:hypothetical protein [Alphaproteobacteria bacterium]